jgi:hypothetical protein
VELAFEKSILKTKRGANEMKPGDRSRWLTWWSAGNVGLGFESGSSGWLRSRRRSIDRAVNACVSGAMASPVVERWLCILHRGILDRLNEISFNSPLMKELRMIALLRQAADPGHGEGARWAGMRTHRIMTDKLVEFGASSKLNAEWEFLSMLKAEGRKSAERAPTIS